LRLPVLPFRRTMQGGRPGPILTLTTDTDTETKHRIAQASYPDLRLEV
jgi:hypothetical protein